MKSRGGHFWLMLALLLGGGAGVYLLVAAGWAGGGVMTVWGAGGAARVPRKSLEEFPWEWGGWQKRGPDARFDAETEAVLRADDYVSRDYMTADGRAASLYVGYYQTQRE